MKGSRERPTPVRLVCALGLAVAIGLFLFPASALAVSTHPFLGSFCEPTGIGSAPCEPSFTEPEGLAVDQASGDLLVIDAGATGAFA